MGTFDFQGIVVTESRMSPCSVFVFTELVNAAIERGPSTLVEVGKTLPPIRA